MTGWAWAGIGVLWSGGLFVFHKVYADHPIEDGASVNWGFVQNGLGRPGQSSRVDFDHIFFSLFL